MGVEGCGECLLWLIVEPEHFDGMSEDEIVEELADRHEELHQEER